MTNKALKYKRFYVENDSSGGVSVYCETNEGFEYICSCGDARNEYARSHAMRICELLAVYRNIDKFVKVK